MGMGMVMGFGILYAGWGCSRGCGSGWIIMTLQQFQRGSQSLGDVFWDCDCDCKCLGESAGKSALEPECVCVCPK